MCKILSGTACLSNVILSGQGYLRSDIAEKEDAESSSRGRSYARSALVVVDEVGYMPISRQEAHLFFQFISRRYERASNVITSNKSFTEWEEMFGDPVIASAMLDRLLHHCRVINIKGNSYRMKGFRESNS